jgi:ferrous iron transport protein A
MILNKEESFPLSHLRAGESGRITGFDADASREPFFLRLLEVGFLPGERIEVLNLSPFGGDPISVQVMEGVYAIRLREAERIRVTREVL